MILRAVLLLASIFLVISPPTVLPAAERYVDGSVSGSGDGASWETAFKTIQEGIDAASDGDAVIVAEGTYVENVQFRGKNIVLRSTDPTNWGVVESTIIDGDQAGSVILFFGVENETCVLTGFTIRNGSADSGGGIRGALLSDHTRATIRNNIITGNSATSRGGGLAYCDGAIRNNIICGNSAGNTGGGVFDCNGTIENNTIADNSADRIPVFLSSHIENSGDVLFLFVFSGNIPHISGLYLGKNRLDS